jgi:flavin reductase (DIM6/NTAB) family NADH-FMN oxidoreductase RutF
MSESEPSTNSSGGGIVFGGSRSGSGDGDLARGLRRRWASGVAIATAVDPHGGLRGVTVSSLMHVSLDPPSLAIALATGSSFHELLPGGASFTISILDRSQEFIAERFAGRAPVPDARFSDVPHATIDDGLPTLSDALAWCQCRVSTRFSVGDHVLIVAEIIDGALGPDTDDPMLSYEGQYRGLEVR